MGGETRGDEGRRGQRGDRGEREGKRRIREQEGSRVHRG